MKPRHFMIVCGGTGGHLAPGIALAQGILKRGHTCRLLISQKQVDSRLAGRYPEIPVTVIPSAPLLLHPVGVLRFIRSQLMGVIAARRLLKSEKTDIVVAFGGFTSFGAVAGAWMEKIPVALHEANRRPGRAIRFLRGLADRIYLPKGIRLRGVAPRKVRHLGFPVRSEIRPMSRESARQKLGLPTQGRWLVVLGGSQGAASLNDWVKDHFESLGGLGINIYTLTGMGKGTQGSLSTQSGEGNQVQAVFVPFSDDMATVISAADLVLTRAGAGTIAELIRCRKPSILIPYPYAADNHQQHNARFHEQQGGGLVVSQDNLLSLKEEVKDLIFNEWLLGRFQSNLERLDRDDQRELILEDLFDLMERLELERNGGSRLNKRRKEVLNPSS
jgi:UDP-N-acetylglucosamine--N-acetylmuramyl-(pentapeptide) pyrophosphoryl-undecaprenol N-acetylglucosamine transferase